MFGEIDMVELCTPRPRSCPDKLHRAPAVLSQKLAGICTHRVRCMAEELREWGVGAGSGVARSGLLLVDCASGRGGVEKGGV